MRYQRRSDDNEMYDAPADYFGRIRKQTETKIPDIGNIMDVMQLQQNMEENALPPEIVHMTVEDYDEFLLKRRRLMAKMIETYYKQL